MKHIKLSMIGLLFVLSAVLSFTGCTSCDETHPRRDHKPRPKQVQVKGEFLRSENGKGVYAYRGDDGFWWYYYFVLSNTTVTRTQDGSYSYVPPSSLPSGGTWTKGTTDTPKTEEVEKEVTETVDESATGQPETAEQFEVENQRLEPENNDSSEPSEPSSTPSEASPSDSGSGSSGSDSSSSGDSGGDGGGGSSD